MITIKTWLKLWTVALIGLMSCVDQIPIDIPIENIQNLVFEARLIQDESGTLAIINVTHLLDFSQSRSLALNVKDTYIVNEQGQQLQLERVGEGNYKLNIPRTHSFKIINGESYKARVEIKDGRVYESDYDLMPLNQRKSIYTPEALIKKITVDQEIKEELVLGIEAQVPTESNGNKLNYKWEFSRTYRITDSPIDGSDPKVCYITENLFSAQTFIISGNSINNSAVKLRIAEFPVVPAYAEDAYIHLQEQVISDSVYLYWENVYKLNNRSGQLFEEPPGRIFSNFKNIADPNEEVFGLFYCSAQNTYRIFVDHELVGSPNRICPPNVPPSPNPCPVVSCCDCLNATISTTEKPVWWVN